MGQASTIRPTSDPTGMEHPIRTEWVLLPLGVRERAGVSRSAWVTATVMDILIITTPGGDPGVTTGLVVGGRPGGMAGVDMPVPMCTDAGETRPTPTHKPHGLIPTPETTEPQAERHFKTRSAAQWESLVEEVIRISILGIRSLGVVLPPMIRKRGLWPVPAQDTPEIFTAEKARLDVEGSPTTLTLALESQ